MIKDGKDASQLSGEVSVYNHSSYFSLICKHKSWHHEKEYGALVSTKYGNFFPAIPSKIYMGMNYPPKYEKVFWKLLTA